MCFSFEISIGTFLFSWIISIYLLKKGLKKRQKQHVITLMIFSTIQLADALLWYSKFKRNNLNYYVTSVVIPAILCIQILYNLFVMGEGKYTYLNYIAIVMCVYIFIRFNGYSKSLCNNKFSSPIWGSNDLELWELLIFAFMIFVPLWKPLFLTIIILIPAIHIFAGGAYGSLWCAISNIYALYYLYKF